MISNQVKSVIQLKSLRAIFSSLIQEQAVVPKLRRAMIMLEMSAPRIHSSVVDRPMTTQAAIALRPMEQPIAALISTTMFRSETERWNESSEKPRRFCDGVFLL